METEQGNTLQVLFTYFQQDKNGAGCSKSTVFISSLSLLNVYSHHCIKQIKDKCMKDYNMSKEVKQNNNLYCKTQPLSISHWLL